MIQRQFMCSGVIAALVANAFRDKGSKPFTPLDFVPGYQQPQQSDDDLLAAFEAFAEVHNKEQMN